MRNVVLWSVLAIVLTLANWSIVSKERVLTNGETMLLRLAPRDPRSLLQGDFMVLRYALSQEIMQRLDDGFSATGVAVVRLDENGVAELVRLDAGDGELASDERLLLYRKRGEQLRVAGDAFFFEEGRQDLYAGARYGELRVDATGDAVLVGLRDDEFNRLGAQDGGP
jgi:uncharacterized membrane-anchored protein